MRITTHINYPKAPKTTAPIPKLIKVRRDNGIDRRFNWTEEENATLSKLWALGLTTSAIAAQMPGRNRNMVIGQSHRLGLPSRPSPIKRS